MERDEDVGDRGEFLEFSLPLRCAPVRELDPILVPFDDESEYSDGVWRRAYLECNEFGADYRRLEAATAGGRRVADDVLIHNLGGTTVCLMASPMALVDRVRLLMICCLFFSV